jgi:hypothetical protein
MIPLAPFVVSLANQGTANTLITVPAGGVGSGGTLIPPGQQYGLPQAGDLMWLFGGANNSNTFLTGVTDTAGSLWLPGPANPGTMTNQPCAAFYAIAPRDFTPADSFIPAFSTVSNQRMVSVGACRGAGGILRGQVGLGYLTGSFAVDSLDGSPVLRRQLLVGMVQNGSAGGVVQGLNWGETNRLSGWQASTNQFQSMFWDRAAADGLPLRITGSIAASNTWSALAMAFDVAARPLRIADGSGWPQVGAAGSRVWTGDEWLVVA